VEGALADLDSGEQRPTRERLHELITELEPLGDELHCSAELAHAHELAERNGAMRQRDVAAEHGVRGVAAWLADRFGDGLQVPVT
jgi:gamma-glutamyl:cysteine ligase YbdK (ATP-grasp superfamily)